jgi:DNA-nicking Smr family endonuclease
MSEKSDFGAILAQWESQSDSDNETKEILKEKGDTATKTVPLSISTLREMLPESEVDLHGLTADQARARTSGFIASSRQQGLRKVSIVTGKGLHSAQGTAVVRDQVMSLLRSSRLIREIQSVPERYGGSGAIWVILKRG